MTPQVASTLISSLLASSAFTLIALGHLVRVFSPSPNCINSILVHSVDGFCETSEERTAAAAVTQRLKATEDFLGLVKPKDWILPTLHLSIDRSHKGAIGRENSKWIFGSEVLSSFGHLERSVFKAFLFRNLPSSQSNDELTLDMWSDALLILQKGEFEIENPVSRKKIPLRSHPVEVLMSFRGACQSEWKNWQLDPLCDLESSNEMVNSVLQQISPLSLRLAVAQIFEKQIRPLKLVSKIEFARNWIQSLNKRALPSVDLSDVRGLGDFISEARRISKSLFDFKNIDNTAGVDVIFVDYANRAQSLSKILAGHSNLVIVANKAKLVWTPASGSPVWFEQPIRTGMRVESVALQSCRSPTFREIKSYQEFGDRLLFVKSCDLSKNPRYNEYLDLGPRAFAAVNPDVKFASFYLPAVETAIRWKYTDLPKSRFLSLTGLNHPHDIPDIKAQKITGVLGAVEYIRGRLDDFVQTGWSERNSL